MISAARIFCLAALLFGPGCAHGIMGGHSDREASQLRFRLEEESPAGTEVGNLVRDANLRTRYGDDVIADLRFRFVADAVPYFEIGVTSGVVMTTAKIDRDGQTVCRQRDTCEIHLSVVIQPLKYLHIVKVIVEIVDLNDNAPMFKDPQFHVRINEAAAEGSAHSLPAAVDWDSPRNGVRRYELGPGSPSASQFRLRVTEKMDGSSDVLLVLTGRLDREVQAQFYLELVAFDGGVPIRKGTIDVIVTVLDSNDNRPEFGAAEYRVNVPENVPVGRIIAQVQATDPDLGPAGEVDYGFAAQTQALYGHVFGIRNASGNVYVKGSVDHERAAVYQLIVTARDRGPDSIATEAAVVVHVDDENDNSPVLIANTLLGPGHRLGSAGVPEDSPVGTFVAQVSVTDSDSGANGRVSCALSGDAFRLVQRYATEYQVVTAAAMDRETVPQYGVTLSCHDFGVEPRTTELQIKVSVLDVNDNAPMFLVQTYKGTLTENNQVGASVLQVAASDWDEGDNGRVVYSIPGNLNVTFHVDQRGVVTAQESIDREKYDGFRFPVLAVDMGRVPLTGSALVVVTVEDVNDERPRFVQPRYAFNVTENRSQGTRVGTVVAVDRDSSAYSSFVYSFVSGDVITDQFSIDPRGGVITTRRALDREVQESYQVTVMAADPKVGAMFGTASVAVLVTDENDNSPLFDHPTPTNSTVTVSSLLPSGRQVTRVVARDRDSGENGRVVFSISASPSLPPEAPYDDHVTNYFRIDRDTGSISVFSTLTSVQNRIFHLSVVATDNGPNPRSTTADLTIMVNSTVPYDDDDDDDHDDQDAALTNFRHHGNSHTVRRLLTSGSVVYVIVAVVVGCVVVVVASFVALVVVGRRKSRRRRMEKTCRMETTLKALMTPSREGTPVELVVSKGGRQQQQGGSREYQQHPMDTPDVTTNTPSEGHPWTVKMPPDLELDSVHSGESSVTDSGRGPSEEGGGGGGGGDGPRQRFIPPPPPPTRGHFWLQQQQQQQQQQQLQRSHHPHPHHRKSGFNGACSVRFQGLNTTPEEYDDDDGDGGGDGAGSPPRGHGVGECGGGGGRRGEFGTPGSSFPVERERERHRLEQCLEIQNRGTWMEKSVRRHALAAYRTIPASGSRSHDV